MSVNDATTGSQAAPAYRRVLLKLSGEALMGEDAFGINRATVEGMVADLAEVVRLGVEVAGIVGSSPGRAAAKADSIARRVDTEIRRAGQFGVSPRPD